MKRASRLIRLTSIAVFLLSPLDNISITASVQAQENTPPALPTPEMQRLAKFYVGAWDYTETYPKSGAQNTGAYTSELGPGGNSLLNHFHSRGPAGESEGMLVMTWDANEKAYKEYVFGADFSGAFTLTGQWDGDTLVFRGELSAGAMKIALRNPARLTAPGKMLSEQYSSANAAPESLLVRVEATKRP
jgi:hypothetical protein